jgi:hypothetical protein
VLHVYVIFYIYKVITNETYMLRTLNLREKLSFLLKSVILDTPCLTVLSHFKFIQLTIHLLSKARKWPSFSDKCVKATGRYAEQTTPRSLHDYFIGSPWSLPHRPILSLHLGGSLVWNEYNSGVVCGI